MSGTTANVTAVIVNYNSGNRLPRLLERLGEEVAQIVVVDNASSDGSQSAAQGRDGVTLLRNETNAGFAAAANQGAKLAKTRWLLFVNPDTHPDAGAVKVLTNHVPDDVAVVAPVQLGPSGEPIPETGGHDASLPRFAAWAFLPGRLRADYGPWLTMTFPMGDFYPDWVSGAFMAVRRDAFERVHGFNTDFFLYLEDADLCRRIRTTGSRVMCRAWVRVHHEVAQGDPRRRAEETGRFVRSLAMQFRGWRLRALGFTLIWGFGIRAILGKGPARTAARRALPECLELLRSD